MSGLEQTGMEGTQALRYGTGSVHLVIVVYGYGDYPWATALNYNILRTLPSYNCGTAALVFDIDCCFQYIILIGGQITFVRS